MTSFLTNLKKATHAIHVRPDRRPRLNLVSPHSGVQLAYAMHEVLQMVPVAPRPQTGSHPAYGRFGIYESDLATAQQRFRSDNARMPVGFGKGPVEEAGAGHVVDLVRLPGQAMEALVEWSGEALDFLNSHPRVLFLPCWVQNGRSFDLTGGRLMTVEDATSLGLQVLYFDGQDVVNALPAVDEALPSATTTAIGLGSAALLVVGVAAARRLRQSNTRTNRRQESW